MPLLPPTAPQSEPQPYDPFIDFDATDFILAMASQLPTVEDGSLRDEISPMDSSPSTLPSRDRRESKIVKLTWWRPHGPTAIAPGLKRLTLKVKVDSQRQQPTPVFAAATTASDLFDASGRPAVPLMRHLLDVFEQRFECQFPFLSCETLRDDLDTRSGSVFLHNAVAAVAARFSTHPAIALSSLQPHEYGNRFAAQAHSLLAPMLGVPSRQTVIALSLLAHVGFANDNESEEWMFAGMAVRMAIDLGLHLDPEPGSAITDEDKRLNRLVFWSVLLLDYALSFGVGRNTTFRVEEVTQSLPVEDDMRAARARSPFPFAARQMFSYGRLINLLNGKAGEGEAERETLEREIQEARETAIREYHCLPLDMQWNAQNLQQHSRERQASIFVHIHLWMHTIIASGYLTAADLPRRLNSRANLASGTATPTAAAATSVWRNSIRTIGDVLVLCDVIDPYAYLALPFVNQAFFVAGCCYIKEIEQHREHGPPDAGGHSPRGRAKQIELFRSLLMSVATTSISTLQSGLAKQTTYWSGVAWVAGALQQRISGIQAHDVDLVKVQETLNSYIALPDEGLVRGQAAASATVDAARTPAESWTGFDIGSLDLLSLPFDASAVEGAAEGMMFPFDMSHTTW